MSTGKTYNYETMETCSSASGGSSQGTSPPLPPQPASGSSEVALSVARKRARKTNGDLEEIPELSERFDPSRSPTCEDDATIEEWLGLSSASEAELHAE